MNVEEYRKKICDFVGRRSPIDVLAETSPILSDIVRDTPADLLRQRPFAGKWTPLEIIGHLSDVEWTWGFRIRTVYCDEAPAILGMDQEKWALRLRHNDREPAVLLGMFMALRQFNLDLWRRIPEEDLERVGVHSERGPESLRLMRTLHAGHDLSHLDQIRRYLAAIASGA